MINFKRISSEDTDPIFSCTFCSGRKAEIIKIWAEDIDRRWVINVCIPCAQHLGYSLSNLHLIEKETDSI